MDNYALMIAKISEFMRLDLMFFSFGIVHGAFAGTEAPGAFNHALFADEVGGLNRVSLVGSTEAETVPEVEGEHFGFVMAERRHEGRGALRGSNDGGSGFANHIHAVVIAGAVFAGGHETLGFVSPQDEEIITRPFGLVFVEPAKGVVVKKEFEEGIHVAAFGLEALGHGDEDDFALIDGAEVEGAFASAEDFGDFGRQKVLKVIANGFAHAAKLLVGLAEKAIRKMSIHRDPAWCFEKTFEVFQFFFQETTIRQQFKSADQSDGTLHLVEHFERVRDVRLRLALKETFVPSLPKACRCVYDELCVGREGDGAVAGEIVAMCGHRVWTRLVGADL